MNTSTITLVDGEGRKPLAGIREAVDAVAGKYGEVHVEIRAPYDEAVKILKARAIRGVAYFIRARQWSPEKDPARAKEGHGFDVSANVRTTRSEALRYLESAYWPKLRERGNVEMSLYGTCLFIGG